MLERFERLIGAPADDEIERRQGLAEARRPSGDLEARIVARLDELLPAWAEWRASAECWKGGERRR